MSRLERLLEKDSIGSVKISPYGVVSFNSFTYKVKDVQDIVKLITQAFKDSNPPQGSEIQYIDTREYKTYGNMLTEVRLKMEPRESFYRNTDFINVFTDNLKDVGITYKI